MIKIENSFLSPKCSPCPLQSHPQPPATSVTFSVPGTVPFPEYHRNGLIKYVQLWLLWEKEQDTSSPPARASAFALHLLQ